MRLLIWPFLVIFLLGLQSTWFKLFNSAQAPDLLLLFVLLYSLDAGEKHGAICGFCVGAIQDVLTFSLFGFHIVTRCLVGLVVGASRGSVFKDRPITFVMLVGLTSVVIKVVYTVVLMLFNWEIFNVSTLLVNSGKYLLWNLVCALPVWFIYNIAKEWLWQKENPYYHL